MHCEATIKDIPISLYAELVSRNHTYLYSMLLHDFKGHLSSIAINLELLKETLPLDEIQTQDIDIMATTRQSIASIEAEIESVRLFMQTLLSNIEVPRLSPSPISLTSIVRGARDFVESEIKRYQVTVEIQSVPDENTLVMGSQKVMEHVFLNILLHILKPGNKASKAVNISVTEANSSIEVTFTRNLPAGLPPQQNGYFQDELLVKNSNGQNFLVMALEAHGGSLNLASGADHRTYTIRLPAIG